MTDFALLLGMGAVVSQLRLARVVPVHERNAWLGAGGFILAAAVAGARLVYCLQRFSYFGQRPLEAVAVWLGGLAWPGAVIGAWAAMVLLFFAWQKPLAEVIDFSAVMLLPLAVTGWLAAWTEGIAYGPVEAAGTWWALPSQDVSENAALHFPLQLLATLALFLGLAAVEKFAPRIRRRGATGVLTWLIFSLVMFGCSLLRTDPSPVLAGLRVETWFAALFAGISSALLLGLLLSRKAKAAVISPALVLEIEDGKP